MCGHVDAQSDAYGCPDTVPPQSGEARQAPADPNRRQFGRIQFRRGVVTLPDTDDRTAADC